MSEHERIWLEPAPGADEDYGRQWAQHNVWPDGIEYIRADLADTALDEAQHDAVAAETELRIVSKQLSATKGVASKAITNGETTILLTEFRKFVDLIEGRAMACDGPVTPFLEELHASADVEKDRFVGILRRLYACKELSNG